MNGKKEEEKGGNQEDKAVAEAAEAVEQTSLEDKVEAPKAQEVEAAA